MRESPTLDLFKYQIRFAISLFVAEICAVKATPLFR